VERFIFVFVEKGRSFLEYGNAWG